MGIRAVLIDDHVVYRESLKCALEHSNLTFVGVASNAREAAALIESTKPDLAVIDFLLPDGNGLSLVKELRRRRLRAKTLILGRIPDVRIITEAKKLKIGFVLKQEPIDVIKAAIEMVCQGDPYISPRLQQRFEEEGQGTPWEQLSGREREIFFLLLQGQTSKEIARALFISAKTVDAHRSHINRKLGVRSLAMLTRFAADHGLVKNSA